MNLRAKMILFFTALVLFQFFFSLAILTAIISRNEPRFPEGAHGVHAPGSGRVPGRDIS